MLHLHKANTDDCSLIHAMAAIAFPATYCEILSKEQIEYMFQWMYSPENLRKQMEVDHHVYFIAYKKEEACGYVSVEQQEEELFHLHKIYVLPQYQGNHVGSFLFQAIIDHIKTIHPSPCKMELTVNRHNNKALHFYERIGMKKLREEDFDIGNGYYMNDYIMGIEL